MRPVLAAVVVLIVASVAISVSRSRLNYAARSRRGHITEADDPAMAVWRAEMNWASVTRPNHCQSISFEQGDSGSTDTTLTEAATRDRYRQLVNQRAADGSRTKREFIVIDRDIYSRDDDGPWVHAVADLNHIPSQQIKPGLTPIAASGYNFNDVQGRTLLKRTGRERVDESNTLVYEMNLSDPGKNLGWTVRYWIGTDDVLPRKTEEIQFSNGLEIARKTTACRYGAVTISPPQ